MADRSESQRLFRRFVLHPIQGAGIFAIFYTLRVLPITWGSALGSFLFRLIGPLLRSDRTARRNLKQAFPELSEDRIDALMQEAWDNLGRGAGEWASVDLIDTTDPNGRVRVDGEEIFTALKESDKGFILVSGHFGNWEISSLLVAQRGMPLTTIYRPASIPAMEYLFRKVRGKFMAELIPKDRSQMRHIVAAIKAGKQVGMLIDQRLNEGLPVPFFGRDAMTTPTPAEMAIRYDVPLVPVLAERLPGVRFRYKVLPPLELPTEGTREERVHATLVAMNKVLEDWIREHPGQWFWMHRRWPD